MVKKKVDPRVKGLIEHGVRKGQRSMFILVGDHGKDQVENLHKILSKTRIKARPSVLWCYKKDLGFSTHKKKRMKEIKRNQQRGLHDPDVDDPFDLFISTTDIRWTYYKETDRILGQTFGMCVLQDFEAITPNLLARTIETVEGGGLVIVLLKTVKSLNQLYTMTMDVHQRYRTEAHHEIVPRFNERFILSLGDCRGCLVLDDELNILPISSHVQHLPSSEGFGVKGGSSYDEGDSDLSGHGGEDPELKELKLSLADTPNIGGLVGMTRTIDQAKAVMSFLDAVSELSLRSTVSLTAGRGRGKSAAIGLCLAGAVSYGYSNIFVTAPSPENLKTVFEFVISGLKELKYNEHLDFEPIYEHFGETGKVVTRINIFRGHRQTIQYILPTETAKLSQAELLAIDEAAAIPLPTVKKLLGPYLVFLSSTINGYEGTGRALSLKLIQQLRTQQSSAVTAAAQKAGDSVAGPRSMKGEKRVHEERWKVAAEAAAKFATAGAQSGARTLTEITLDTPIRYKAGDPIENWLNSLLCLDIIANSTRIVTSIPAPRDCELYYVDRDALFSYHSLSETLLQRIWALYTSAHYKNSPNDLQMLSDAPAHRLFVLLGPQKSIGSSSGVHIPDILCVVQVALEGKISRQSVQSELLKGNKASGDMIPWTISQQFNDSEFAALSGARVVRIATHPDVQSMGYGSRAIDLLIQYFQGELSFGKELKMPPSIKRGEHECDDAEEESLLSSAPKPRKKLPSLLTNVCDYPCERLHWIGVSFGLTGQLLNFWSRKGFKICYLRQTSNELTGEHSSIMLHELECSDVTDAPQGDWLSGFVEDYRRRMISLLSFSFSALDISTAITLLDPNRELTAVGEIADDESGAESRRLTLPGLYHSTALTSDELTAVHMSQHDVKRLELYSRNMVDHHMIIDLLPTLAKLLFGGRLPFVRLTHLQLAVLLAVGLQHRDVDSISSELDLPVNQVLAFFNKTIRRITAGLRSLLEASAKKELPSSNIIFNMQDRAESMTSTAESLVQDQRSDERAFSKKLAMQTNLVVSMPKTDSPSPKTASDEKKKKKKNKNSWKPKRKHDESASSGVVAESANGKKQRR